MTDFPEFKNLEERLAQTLREDLSEFGDVTSRGIFPSDMRCNARIVSKEPGVICGLPLIKKIFITNNPARVPEISFHVEEGDGVEVEQVLVELEGFAIDLLQVERTMLNFLQRLSGTATITRQFLNASDGKLKICDTRKTTPLWRDLEKYAVKTGGGTNHRMGLYDMAMIKDTHADAIGGLAKAISQIRSNNLKLPYQYGIAVETRNLDEVRVAVEANVDLIMLDNMSNDMMREAVRIVDGKIETEITGNVTLDRIGDLCDIGADRVSIGALTHSVKALDLSMRMN